METAMKTRPRFRTDLVAQPIEDKGQVFVDVTDPDTGATFRFYEIEYSVACAMDGARDLEALRAWARDELGVEPSHEELSTVVATLDELGYLDHGPGAPSAASTIPGGAEAPRASDVELGSAGVSPGSAPRPKAAAEDMALGQAGAGSRAEAAVPATSGAQGEASFEGLMEDDAGSSEGSRAGTNPFARTSLPIQAGEGDEEAVPAKPASSMGSGGALRDRARQTDDEDGPTNIPAPQSQFDEEEVSVDLSDHLSIGTDDVKEAVRQSQVMKIPEAPEADAEPAKASEDAAKKKAADKAEKAAKEQKADKPASKSASKSAEMAAVAKPKEPPPAASEGSGLRVALVVILVFALLGGAGYYAVFHLGILDDGDSQAAAPADAAEPAAPPQPTAVLSEEDVEPVFLEASDAGEVSWIAETGAAVAEGDEVLRLAGYEERAEALGERIDEETELQDRLDQATAEDDRRRMQRIESRVEDAQAQVAEAEAELEAYRVLAPQDGIFEADVELGDELEAGDPMGVIAAEPRHIGVFEIDTAEAFSEGQAVTLTSEGAGEVASCEVTAAGTMTITVACPTSSPFGPGDTVGLSH